MVVIRIQIHFGSSFFVILKDDTESYQNLFWTHRRMSHDANPKFSLMLKLVWIYVVPKTPLITRHNWVEMGYYIISMIHDALLQVNKF